MLDWNDLRVVRAVECARSLAGAARALSLHQTTVGRRLRAAEEALGVPLFLRSATGVAPTPAGTRLFAALDTLGRAVESLERQAMDLTRDEGGLVRLAVTENTARVLLPTALSALRARHPEICVELVPGNTAIDLVRGEADLAVRMVSVDEPDFVRRHLGQVSYGLYASPGYLAARGLPLPGGDQSSATRRPARGKARRAKAAPEPNDWLAGAEAAGFAGHDALVPSRELASGPEANWMAKRAARATSALYASSHVTLAEAAAAGLGFAVLPDNLARQHAGLVRLRVLPEIPGRAVWLVLHRDLRRVTRVRRVADAVAKALQQALTEETRR